MQTKILLLLVLVSMMGCSKGFLETKPRSDIIEPGSLADLTKMLESETIANTPALPVLSSDEYYYRTAASWQSVSATERNTYTWAKDVFGGEVSRQDWRYPYIGIFYANNVLEYLIKMDSTGTAEGRKIKGWALFIRAYNFYNLVKNFAPAYNESTATSDPGVPLKLSARVDEILPRASVKAVYDQILQDLNEARQLLPGVLPVNRNQPCAMAADALLARIGLTMRNYTMAEKYADSCLVHYKKLINYNSLSTTSGTPFTMNNEEVLFASSTVVFYQANRVFSNPLVSVDTVLLKKYNINDLRASVYYGKTSGFTILKRGYFGPAGSYPFTGLATDEVYLVKAECAARRNAIDTCLFYLNNLLVNRYKGTYTNLTATTGIEALQLTLDERRKELVWRGLRWDDLARLNKEGANITLIRVLDGMNYSIEPNSPRYIFNIPADEIALSGIAQNER